MKITNIINFFDAYHFTHFIPFYIPFLFPGTTEAPATEAPDTEAPVTDAPATEAQEGGTV